MEQLAQHRKNSFSPLFGWSILLAVPLMISCNRAEKQKDVRMPTDLTTVAEKPASFQELGFFGPIKADKWTDFLNAVQQNIYQSRKEAGNISFSLYLPENGHLGPIWFERFENKAAHNHHKGQSYFKEAIKVIQESLEGAPKSITLQEIKEIPAAIPITADEPERTRHIIVLFHLRPEKRKLFVESMAEVARRSRNFPGNLEFNIYQYEDDPNKFVVMEGWASIAEHEVQLQQDYIKTLRAKTQGFFVSDPMDSRWPVRDISVKMSTPLEQDRGAYSKGPK
tara:strand:+ start:7762 stop:8604 length:843 start_codon:yes stop_codon:yes gene_type:complete